MQSVLTLTILRLTINLRLTIFLLLTKFVHMRYYTSHINNNLILTIHLLLTNNIINVRSDCILTSHTHTSATSTLAGRSVTK